MHRFSFLSFFLLLTLSAGAQSSSSNKIDLHLLERFTTTPECEFLIIMQQQADLSLAEQFRTKVEKGEYVYQTLLDMSENTQGNVRDLLRQADVPAQSFWIINAVWAKGPLSLVEQIAQLPEVARIDDNPVMHNNLPQVQNDAGSVQERALNPWGLAKINAPAAWALNYKGQGVVVGGQDTGYSWNHRAIKEKYRGWNAPNVDHNYNWHDAIHSLINGISSNSCGLDLTSPCDDNRHGTHTMGTMVGSPAPDSIIGVAPEAKWIGCRNMEEGDGTPSTYIECFQWFVAPTNLTNSSPQTSMAPNVINNSWGCPTSEGCNSGNFAAMETVVNNVRAAGIMVVVSAGNDGPSCSTINSPAAIFTSSFSVGATNSSDAIAGFSSRGPVTNNGATAYSKPDISAPGSGVISCVGTDNNQGLYGYSSLSGTSMAGPHVAGVVALILSARSDLMGAGNVGTIETIIKSSAVPLYTTEGCGGDLSTTRPNNTFGWGRIDAMAAVNAAIQLPIELLSFEVQEKGDDALVLWATASENECSHFDVLRSADGINWYPVGQVSCLEPAPAGRQYAFTDEQPLPGNSYYRLRQTDVSGSSILSRLAIFHGKNGRINLHINPSAATQSAFVHISGEEINPNWSMEIYAIDGRLIQKNTAPQQGALALPYLPMGLYVAQLTDGEGRMLAQEKFWWK